MIRDLSALLAEHPIFAGLDPDQLTFIAGCGWNVAYHAGDRLFRAGEPADRFFLLRSGRVALEVRGPSGPAHTVQTLETGDVLGWSWLFPPHHWQFDARALEDVRATAFDGVCLRGKCDGDAELGYALMRRFASVVTDRLQATRLQLLDLYGTTR